ncbi:MAG: hypothetical protein JW768_09480 [Chitinispirillaceae bacterium]|nr:hypothetical protein [Chitinispirillaceae bacterium]
MMLKIPATVFLSFVLAGSAFPGISEQQARFLAGVFVLQSRNGLSPAEKALRFRVLEAMSGVTAAEARTLLRSVRENPQEWRRVNEAILHIVNESQAAGDSVAAAQQAPLPAAAIRR